MQIVAGFIALVVVAAAAASNPARPAATTEPIAISLAPTALGCDITIRAHNRGSANVTIDLEDSEVKVRNGFWKKFGQGGNWVINTGGEHESKVVALDLGCDLRRQYKFLMRSGGDSKYIYFPAEDDFTETVSLGLANVGRHF